MLGPIGVIIPVALLGAGERKRGADGRGGHLLPGVGDALRHSSAAGVGVGGRPHLRVGAVVHGFGTLRQGDCCAAVALVGYGEISGFRNRRGRGAAPFPIGKGSADGRGSRSLDGDALGGAHLTAVVVLYGEFEFLGLTATRGSSRAGVECGGHSGRGGSHRQARGGRAPCVGVRSGGRAVNIAPDIECRAWANGSDVADANGRNGMYHNDGVPVRHSVGVNVLHRKFDVLVAGGGPLGNNRLGIGARRKGAVGAHLPGVSVVIGVARVLGNGDFVVGFGTFHTQRRRNKAERIQHQGVVDDNLERINGRAASGDGIAGGGGRHGVGAGCGGSAVHRHRVGCSRCAGHTGRQACQGQRAVVVFYCHICDGLSQRDCLGGVGGDRHDRQRVHLEFHLLVGLNGVAVCDGDGILEPDGGALCEIGIRIGE